MGIWGRNQQDESTGITVITPELFSEADLTLLTNFLTLINEEGVIGQFEADLALSGVNGLDVSTHIGDVIDDINEATQGITANVYRAAIPLRRAAKWAVNLPEMPAWLIPSEDLLSRCLKAYYAWIASGAK